jgi:hypothetical protein
MSRFASLRSAAGRLPRYGTAAMLAVVFGSQLFGQATGYSGSAYGTEVTVSPGTTSITAGTTAATVLCTEETGVNNSNSVTSVTLAPLGSTGAIYTSASSSGAGGVSTSTAIATVNGLSLLGGLIAADAVQSESSSISSSGGFSTSATGTNFTNATVLGIPVLADVAPNTRIVLVGIGYVILNEQIPTVTSSSANLVVNAIHIHVSETNALGLPIGTQLILAHARSSTLINVSLLTGFGYGSAVAAGPVHAGPTAEVQLGCTGTNDVLETNSVATVSVPAILTAGAVHTSAQGSVTITSTAGQITASIAGVDLLSNLVSATTITADASVSVSGGAVTLSDSGSLFAGLAVTGHPEVGANPAPNTSVSIAGLGTLWLHRVVETSTSIEVRMVELVVDAANSLGLPVGADLRLAVAHVGVVNP